MRVSAPQATGRHRYARVQYVDRQPEITTPEIKIKSSASLALSPPPSRPDGRGGSTRRSPAMQWQNRWPTPTQTPSTTMFANPLMVFAQALMTSAQDNDLPVPFFANLIWQESRLQRDCREQGRRIGHRPVHARGCRRRRLGRSVRSAQAIPASARLLHALRQHFGNLGLCRRGLQCRRRTASASGSIATANCRARRETMSCASPAAPSKRGENRRGDDAKLAFVRPLPCRSMPAFAELEQVADANETASR